MSIGSRRPRGGLGKRNSGTFGKQRTSDRIRQTNNTVINHYTEDWSAISAQVKREDNYTCTRCGASHRPGDYNDVVLTVDHIIPVSRGGKTIRSNLTTLCSDCHEKKLGKANKRGGKLLAASVKRIRQQRHDKRS
ncbi:hypothetical protein BN7874_275 [Phage NCTB]|nr:hypothetical protein BN7874_275 [Phage NCTB]